MPSGRKSVKKVRGGGFGKSLQQQSAWQSAGINFQKPDPTRCRLNGQQEKEVTVMSFVSTEKAKVSCLQAKDLDDFFAQSLANKRTYEEQRNLVLVGRNAEIVGPARLVDAQGPEGANSSSLFGGSSAAVSSSLFASKKGITDLPLPQRPFTFRDPATRVLDFATFFGRQLILTPKVSVSDDLTAVQNENAPELDVTDFASVKAEDAITAVAACNDSAALLRAIDAYFRRRENFAPLISASDLEAEELAAFSRWRKQIAAIEASNPSIVITPYEKNPEYWKQLWRTIEKSDCVIEIVDARNPLLFRCQALEAMVRRSGKQIILLMNKTDFLSAQQRTEWRAFFEANKLEVIFYSAMRELTRQQTDPTVKLSRRVLDQINTEAEMTAADVSAAENEASEVKPTDLEAAEARQRVATLRKMNMFQALNEEEALGSQKMSSGDLSGGLTGSLSSQHKSFDRLPSGSARSSDSGESLSEGEDRKEEKATAPPPTYLSLLAMDDGDCLESSQLLELLEQRGKSLVAKKTARYKLALAVYDHLETLAAQLPSGDRQNTYTALAKNVLDTLYPLGPAQEATAEEANDEALSEDEDDLTSESSASDSEDSDAESDPGSDSESADLETCSEGKADTDNEDAEGKDAESASTDAASDADEDAETLIQREPREHHVEISKDVRKKLQDSFLSVFVGPKQSLQTQGVEEGLPESAVETFLRPTIGTCGFPNVGKSSLINTLLQGTRRVAVSRTPGKTRHLQTIYVPNSILTLCDCPGLVFPTVANAKEDLVLNNAASVDVFRGSLVPVTALMFKRIPDQIGEVWGVKKIFDKMVDVTGVPLSQQAREAVAEIALSRRYISSGRGGIPDVERTCRLLIKAYCQGQFISYCEKVPTAKDAWWQQEEQNKWQKRREFYGR